MAVSAPPDSARSSIVEAHNLVKRYGERTAVDDVSFAIEEGEIFGLLGPNGAGKSTTIAMLTCLFPPTSGHATIGGLDVVRQAAQVKRLIGVVPQELALYPTLSARANLRFFGEMYGLGGAELRKRIDEALEVVALAERADDRVDSFSGGMKRRVNLAIGLINRPRILFLDEPTVGVDPQSRNHIFESVERLNAEHGMAILYTTHYMEEAERLCRRVGIIDKGRIIALDSPRGLIEGLGGGIIQVGLAQEDEALAAEVAALPAVKGAAFVQRPHDITGAPANGASQESAGDVLPRRALLRIEAEQENAALLEVVRLFNQRDVEILALETLEPNLETVFLHLTGKSLRS